MTVMRATCERGVDEKARAHAGARKAEVRRRKDMFAVDCWNVGEVRSLVVVIIVMR